MPASVTTSTSGPAARWAAVATTVAWAPPTSSLVMIWQTRSGRSPVTALAAEDAADRAADDAQVESQALVAQVEELVLELLEGVGLVTGVAVLDLGPARQAGPHEVAQAVERDLLGQLVDVVRLLGRGPTIDRSPRRMLSTCGSSSRWVRRRTPPKG